MMKPADANEKAGPACNGTGRSLVRKTIRAGRSQKQEIGAMQNYRTYLLDEDGHIANAIDMECTDDEQAKECAKKYLSGGGAELWREERLIATYVAGKGITSGI
jgi:hypothetical protein